MESNNGDQRGGAQALRAMLLAASGNEEEIFNISYSELNSFGRMGEGSFATVYSAFYACRECRARRSATQSDEEQDRVEEPPSAPCPEKATSDRMLRTRGDPSCICRGEGGMRVAVKELQDVSSEGMHKFLHREVLLLR